VKTKGAICWGPGEPWTIEELDMGEPVAGEVRIRLASAGMCRSDEHLRAGDAPAQYPLLGGHEGAGVDEAVGPNVTSLKVGKVSIDKVAMQPFWLSMMQKQIRGTVFGGCNPRTDIPRILDLYKEGRYPLDQFVTKEYRLEEVNTGYADMLAGSNIRGLIRFDESDY
jgi:Zn-dependent alcohol dehydrogenase